ncbi:MAG: hypothetical protein ABSC42_01565 [Tepidisphaeraceae bacterium]
MSTVELRRKIKKQIDGLDGGRLRYAANLLSLLGRSETDDDSGTRIARFRATLAKAERDIAAGRFVPFEKLRRKY